MYGNNGSKKQRLFLVVSALIVTFLAQPGFAETDDFVDTMSQGGNNGGVSGNPGAAAAADKIAAGMVGDPNAVVDSTQTNKSMGREQKANDAASQSGTGKGMAIATGASLMATAIPMLASIDPLTRATGAELMAKAGLEFGQAAANSGTQAANKKQEDLLRAEANQNIGEAMKAAGDSAKQETQNQVANTVAGNPELQKLLGQNGVNADDFAKQFASGGLLSPEAILSATGSAGVDPATMAQAQASAEPLGKQESLTAIQEDGDRDGANTKSGDQSGGGSSGSQANGGKPGGAELDPNQTSNSGSQGGLAGLLDSVAKGGASALDSLKNGSDADLASMLAGLVGMGGMGAKTDGSLAANRLNADALAKKGILKATGKPGIFMLARRNYRSFQKWRRKVTTVAANAR